MEIGGLPLHPLVVHAAVVFTPLAVLGVLVFALWERHRWLTRWPTLALTAVAVASVWTAALSGTALLESRPELKELVETHQARGQLLGLVSTLLLLLVALAAWALPGPTSLASGRGARESRLPAAERWLPLALAVVALAVLVLAVLTGDSGSRAVWG